TQVSGRVGRGNAPGQVFIQTRTPEHPAIQAAATGDFWRFANLELANRRMLGYPPYRHLLKLTTSHDNQADAIRTSQTVYDTLKQNRQIRVLGPAPAFHERAGGRYHWQIVVKAARRSVLVEIARSVAPTWKTDLDPLNVL
ncbi:MAG TPA: hypothetical protein VMR75_02020, partial [Candidatus Saccharimonadales bacterium]|nr:hypothetical protein [Candidatus Saccharimonadales bacterium]